MARGSGHTAFVAGEAGIGKTSLLKALAERRGDGAAVVGRLRRAADAASAGAAARHRALQPRWRFARCSAPTAQRGALFEAVLAELQRSRRPVLVVIEDAHWADDATLDLIRFLGRRIDRAPVLLVVIVPRRRGVGRASAAPRCSASCRRSLITRIECRGCRRRAVDALARRALRSPAGIHAVTQGNPFFVTELLRARRSTSVPRSVQDLVLARFARLGRRRAGDRAARVGRAGAHRALAGRARCSAPTVD